jgi:hypothetical protein
MRETNTAFTRHTIFKKSCELAGIPATSRQASKYRRGLGIAVRQKQRAFAQAAQDKIREIFSKGE